MDICESYSVFEKEMIENSSNIYKRLYGMMIIVIMNEIYEIYDLMKKNENKREE